ncbi:MAG: two-component regulator propeller domain-containing protein [Bacteroidota bacterium]
MAQSNGYVAQQWKVEDGLPQSTVRCITQTTDGYIWAGTWQGLARFDGLQMTIFKSSNTPALYSSNIMSLFSDSHGQLWIGTDAGGLVRYSNGQFKRFDSTDGISAMRILSINEDRSGRIWCATELGVYSFNGEKFLHFTAANGLPRTYANQVSPLPNGGMYIGLVGYGARVQCNGDSLIVESVFPVGGYVIAIDSAGTMWYGIRKKGFIRREGDKEFVDTTYADLKSGETYILRNQEKWLLTTDDIRIISHDGNQVLKQIDGISLSDITTVFEDQEGNIWLGKEGGGLIQLRKKQLQVFSKQNGFPSDLVMCGLEDRFGKLWVGTWDAGLLFCSDTVTKTFSTVKMPDKISSIFTLTESKNGGVWAGAWGSGLYHAAKDHVQRFDKGIFRDEVSIISVVEDTKDGLWIGTAHDGVAYIVGDSITMWNTSRGLSSNRVNALLAAHNGDVWISVSANGVNRISNGTVTVFKKGSGLNDNFASPMYEDHDGAIWIGTNRGLNRWKNGTFTYVTEQQGLFDDAIAQIIEDDLGYFWIGAIHGIYRVRKQELNDAADGKISTVRCFTVGKEDGMVNEETGGGGTPRCWKTSDGKLWFSTSAGAVVIDPRTITSSAVPPKIILEDVWVENQARTISNEITLQPGETKIEFRYTGISFTAPDKIHFKYILEGYDKEWNDAGTQRVVRYTNMGPGTYVFRVCAINSSGIWSKEDASVTVVVLPPFYATWWFRTILIIFFLTIGPAIYFFRVRQLKHEKAKQIEFSRQLIESQESERKRIAAELHDGLGQNLLIIKNKLLVALQSLNEDLQSTQQLVDASEVVSGTIQEVRSISHNLRPHQLDQLGITKTLRSIIRQMKEATSLDIAAEIDDIDSSFSPEQEISLFRIVQESFNNIIKHSKATSVVVELKKTSGALTMIIRDNGVGFNQTNEYQNGFGMSSMQERARILGGTIEIISKNGEGTIVRLSVPILDKQLRH